MTGPVDPGYRGRSRAARVVSAINEERLNRIKLYSGFPKLATQEALRLAGIGPGDVDDVALGSLVNYSIEGRASKQAGGLDRLLNWAAAAGWLRLALGNSAVIAVLRGLLGNRFSPVFNELPAIERQLARIRRAFGRFALDCEE